jgi:hypothetical protein
VTYSDAAAVSAIVAAIQAEQNYVYAAGVAGAFLTGGARRQAVSQLAEHQGRMQIYSLMIAPEAVPAPPPAFEPSEPITNARTARAALAQLNNTLVAINADVAAATESEDRAFAVDCAQLCARAAVQWGAQSQAFPT